MFDFNNTTIEETGNKYLTPGNHVVKGTEVKAGTSSVKGTPYVEITIEDKNNATASQQYYLSTTVKEGSTKSAMDISAPALVRLVAAANNLDINAEADKNKAKSMIGNITTPEQLATKLASLLVGKTFAIHLTGKWVNPTDTTKKPWVKAEFGSGNFATTPGKINTLPTTAKIKGEPATTDSTAGINTTAKADW